MICYLRGQIWCTGSDEVYFQVPDLDELAREVDELTRGASSEVDVPSCSDVANTPDEPVKDYASGWLDNLKIHHWRAPHGNVLLPVCLLH